MNRTRIVLSLSAALAGAGLTASIAVGHNLPPTTGTVAKHMPAPGSPFRPTLRGTVTPDFLAHAASGLPVVQNNAGTTTKLLGFKTSQQRMTATVHIDNASTATILQIQGYALSNNPDLPFNEQTYHRDVTTGPLTLKHTGPGNLWQATSKGKTFIRQTRDLKTVMTVRACNASGCITHAITLSRV